MGRGDDHDVGVEALDDQALVVDRLSDQAQPETADLVALRRSDGSSTATA